jgi:regulator of protease activity HflC (stomatin/prohibitin superfamily)
MTEERNGNVIDIDSRSRDRRPPMSNKNPLIVLAVIVVLLLIFGSRFFVIVQPGHAAVGIFFGAVDKVPLDEGLHIVNPFKNWIHYDCRQKTHTETATVPSQDQLSTSVDVSVQYRINEGMTPNIVQDTGSAEQTINVHLIPKLRSILREQGKTIPRAEDFFKEEVQIALQANLTEKLKDFTESKGIVIESVLIRDVRLPEFIMKAIESKKEREQATERQRAELERFRTEQEQKIAQAEAERRAAEEEAQMRRVLADARAYEIEKINDAVAQNPAYIQLQALEALKDISKDPTAKIYFLSGDSPMPLPLMHMGDLTGGGR